MTTAACLIIGDEILTGKVHDQNSFVLAQVLFERGVRLQTIETISDDVVGIASAVKRLCGKYDLVFTSGGIGPTHDDVTYAGVAKAFAVPLETHAETIAQMKTHYAARGISLNAARRRMATIPRGATVLKDDPDLWVPVVMVKNAYIFPGVPPLFERMLRAIAHRFSGTPLVRQVVQTEQTEGDIADPLAAINARYPKVAIGSYPQFGRQDGVAVRITLEGEEALEVTKATSEVCSLVDGTLEEGPGSE